MPEVNGIIFASPFDAYTAGQDVVLRRRKDEFDKYKSLIDAYQAQDRINLDAQRMLFDTQVKPGLDAAMQDARLEADMARTQATIDGRIAAAEQAARVAAEETARTNLETSRRRVLEELSRAAQADNTTASETNRVADNIDRILSTSRFLPGAQLFYKEVTPQVYAQLGTEDRNRFDRGFLDVNPALKERYAAALNGDEFTSGSASSSVVEGSAAFDMLDSGATTTVEARVQPMAGRNDTVTVIQNPGASSDTAASLTEAGVSLNVDAVVPVYLRNQTAAVPVPVTRSAGKNRGELAAAVSFGVANSSVINNDETLSRRDVARIGYIMSVIGDIENGGAAFRPNIRQGVPVHNGGHGGDRAQGGFQIMPNTAMSPQGGAPNVFTVAKQLGYQPMRESKRNAVLLLKDPRVAAAFAANIIAVAYKKAGGNLALTALGHHGGLGAISRYRQGRGFTGPAGKSYAVETMNRIRADNFIG